MTLREIKATLEQSGFPVAYHHFEQSGGFKLPLVVFLENARTDFYADGINYFALASLQIELYTSIKSPEDEKKLESILLKIAPFKKSEETWIESDKMYATIYECEVTLDDEK